MKNAVIMLTCNRRNYTERTLRSYGSQIGKRNDFDFFIHDNGSNDDTQDFLKSYSGPMKLDVTYSEQNIGIACATKLLLEKKCFGKGYDFIVKVDDDEILPDNWPDILNYWNEIEKHDAPFIGFKRKEINEYFEGQRWVSCNPENIKPIHLGVFECYRSIASPGVQISTEEWWKRVFDDLTDFSALYGGWDYTFMEALVKQNRFFLVVTNFETEHFQRDDDHLEFSRFKKRETLKFRHDHREKWRKTKKDFENALQYLEDLKSCHPDHPRIKELMEKAESIKKKLKKSS